MQICVYIYDITLATGVTLKRHAFQAHGLVLHGHNQHKPIDRVNNGLIIITRKLATSFVHNPILMFYSLLSHQHYANCIALNGYNLVFSARSSSRRLE